MPEQDDGEAAKAKEVKQNRDEAMEEEDGITKGKGSTFEQDGLPSHPTGDAAPAEDPGTTTMDPKAGGRGYKKSRGLSTSRAIQKT